jgi:hypothetical protein
LYVRALARLPHASRWEEVEEDLRRQGWMTAEDETAHPP